MIWIKIEHTGEVRQLDRPVWVRRLSNGTLVVCRRPQARGVSDGAQTWSLGDLEGLPLARIITKCEYLAQAVPEDPDPELTAEEALNIILGGSYESE